MKQKYNNIQITLIVFIVAIAVVNIGLMFTKGSQALAGERQTTQMNSGMDLFQTNLFKQKNLTSNSVVSEDNPTAVSNSVAKKTSFAPAIKRNLRCPAKHDSPSISTENKVNHMDEDCCPDYDEWPKPNCIYSAADYAIMLKGPTPGHITWSQIPKK